MMLSRPRKATMTIKDRQGRARILTAVLDEDDPPSCAWRYLVTVQPSRSKRFLRGEDGEPVERVLGRLANQLTPPRRVPKRPADDEDDCSPGTA